MKSHQVYLCDRCGKQQFADKVPPTDPAASSDTRWPGGWSEIDVQTRPSDRGLSGGSKLHVLCERCTRAVVACLRESPVSDRAVQS